MRKWSVLLVMKEMHIRATVKYHFIPFRMTLIKKTLTSVDKDLEKV